MRRLVSQIALTFLMFAEPLSAQVTTELGAAFLLPGSVSGWTYDLVQSLAPGVAFNASIGFPINTRFHLASAVSHERRPGDDSTSFRSGATITHLRAGFFFQPQELSWVRLHVLAGRSRVDLRDREEFPDLYEPAWHSSISFGGSATVVRIKRWLLIVGAANELIFWNTEHMDRKASADADYFPGFSSFDATSSHLPRLSIGLRH